MTYHTAAYLRSVWNRKTNAPVCLHASLELETDDAGRYLSGIFFCKVCGKAFAKRRVVQAREIREKNSRLDEGRSSSDLPEF
jgi:hypothetical protein